MFASILASRWLWRALAAIALMVAGSELAGTWWYIPRIEQARATAAAADANAREWQISAETLQTALRDQATAVHDIVTRAAARDAAALDAMTTAAAVANQANTAAAAIARSRPPPGVDPCIAARQAFAAELRQERTK